MEKTIPTVPDNSEFIEILDGKKITTDDFKKAYETAIDSISRMQNIEKESMLEFISKNIDELPEQMKALNYQFQKKNFYENYRQMLMVDIAAEKDGFTNRKDIQNILALNQLQTLTTLYINEMVNKRIKITDQEIEEECQKIRLEQKKLASLPVDRCLEFAKAKLKREKGQTIYPKVLERIKEKILVKHNEKFDLDAFLNQKIDVKKNTQEK